MVKTALLVYLKEGGRLLFSKPNQDSVLQFPVFGAWYAISKKSINFFIHLVSSNGMLYIKTYIHNCTILDSLAPAQGLYGQRFIYNKAGSLITLLVNIGKGQIAKKLGRGSSSHWLALMYILRVNNLDSSVQQRPECVNLFSVDFSPDTNWSSAMAAVQNGGTTTIAITNKPQVRWITYDTYLSPES